MLNRKRHDQSEVAPPATDADIRGKGRVDEVLDRELSDIHLKRGDSVRSARDAHLRHFSGGFHAPGNRK
jgi:hypothetical protein